MNINDRLDVYLLTFLAKLDIEFPWIEGVHLGRRFLKYKRSKELADNRMEKEAPGLTDKPLTAMQNNIVI
ncbi:hypothetical protein ATZ36_13135 [Candidatus Endomicrobiellum trichonymphae]|uniref:Uncharacterized protein n=1 Tax=Endomicrobium trichonymphae TaxID=1408204 RepID=A0A1E5IMJ3_ENDTX|nr:hypothetical protein ATZ36_13135 [Candidatus Endomicrobium trichonymphae]